MTPIQESRGLVILGFFLILRLGVAVVWKREFQFEYHLTVKFVAFLLTVFLVMSVGVVGVGMQVWVGMDLTSMWLPPERLWSEILIGALSLLALGGSVLLGGILAWRCGFRPKMKPPAPPLEPTSLSHRLGRGVLTVFFGIAIASFQEETLFRGFLQPILISRWGLYWGLLGQSLIFAASHLGLEPLTSFKRNAVIFSARVAFGLLLGWLAFSRGTLLAAGILHGILG